MNLKDIVGELYLTPTYNRIDLERINQFKDDKVYINIVDNIVGGTGSAFLCNMFLLTISLVILEKTDYFNSSIFKQSDYLIDSPYIKASILSTTIPLLTNICSGIYEAFKNRKKREDVRKGSEILEEIVGEIEANK